MGLTTGAQALLRRLSRGFVPYVKTNKKSDADANTVISLQYAGTDINTTAVSCSQIARVTMINNNTVSFSHVRRGQPCHVHTTTVKQINRGEEVQNTHYCKQETRRKLEDHEPKNTTRDREEDMKARKAKLIPPQRVVTCPSCAACACGAWSAPCWEFVQSRRLERV